MIITFPIVCLALTAVPTAWGPRQSQPPRREGEAGASRRQPRALGCREEGRHRVRPAPSHPREPPPQHWARPPGQAATGTSGRRGRPQGWWGARAPVQEAERTLLACGVGSLRLPPSRALPTRRVRVTAPVRTSQGPDSPRVSRLSQIRGPALWLQRVNAPLHEVPRGPRPLSLETPHPQEACTSPLPRLANGEREGAGGRRAGLGGGDPLLLLTPAVSLSLHPSAWGAGRASPGPEHPLPPMAVQAALPAWASLCRWE